MNNVIISVIYGLTIGLALSVDAFILSLIYGSTFKHKRESLITCFMVGLFHLLMPLLGYFLAFFVFTRINLASYLENKLQIIAFIILAVIGLMMLCKKDNDKIYNIRNYLNKCLFAFSVSVDSFLAGIAFTTINHIHISIVSLLFFTVSCIMTFLALSIGKKTAERLLKANLDYYAGIIMIILAIISLFI